MLFRILAIAGLLLSYVFVFRILRRRNLTIGQFLRTGGKRLSGFDDSSISRRQAATKSWYILALISIKILAITGFLQVMILGEHMSGFLLLLHMIAAPAFAVAIAILTLLTISDHRFSAEDWQAFRSRKDNTEAASNFWRKTCYWLIVVSSIPALASIILSMYPIFGTNGQEALLSWHRYATLVLTIAVIFHTFLIFEASPRQQGTLEETKPAPAQ